MPVFIGLSQTRVLASFWTLQHDQYEDLIAPAGHILIAADNPAPSAKRLQTPAQPVPAGHATTLAGPANPTRVSVLIKRFLASTFDQL